MPKALLICREDQFSWMSPLGPLHPLDLLILEATLAGRWFQWFKSQGIDEVRILTDTPWDAQGLWAPEQIRGFPKGEALPLVIASQKMFWEKSECLILQAPVLFHQACEPKLSTEGHPLEPLLLYRSKAQAVDLGSWRPLTSASHYYIACLEILEKDHPASLSPLPTGAKHPLWLGKQVKHRGVDLGPFTAIGPHTTLGKNAKVQSSVIYGHVVLGPGVEFKEKLILGTTVISPGTEKSTRITDEKILKLQ